MGYHTGNPWKQKVLYISMLQSLFKVAYFYRMTFRADCLLNELYTVLIYSQ